MKSFLLCAVLALTGCASMTPTDQVLMVRSDPPGATVHVVQAPSMTGPTCVTPCTLDVSTTHPSAFYLTMAGYVVTDQPPIAWVRTNNRWSVAPNPLLITMKPMPH